MRAAEVLRRVCEAIDAHQWHELAPLLDEHFECHYVHTGESFARDVWIALNANYPDFDRLVIEDLVGDDHCAAARCHVTARRGDGVAHFAVATFVSVSDDRVTSMTEVWTDIGQPVIEGTRPTRATPA